ncbi:MAG TPA: hypothetical protein P5557_01595 [Candidatus Sumerlaeia bacterium]|nr:hypothetical protein [Candidatus Sumerlaeia bacterium]
MAMAEVRIETIVSPSVCDLRTPPHDSLTPIGNIKESSACLADPGYNKFAFGE